MKASGAKDDMNKEALEEEGEGRKTTCPSDWLNINPDLFQWNKGSFLCLSCLNEITFSAQIAGSILQVLHGFEHNFSSTPQIKETWFTGSTSDFSFIANKI